MNVSSSIKTQEHRPQLLDSASLDPEQGEISTDARSRRKSEARSDRRLSALRERNSLILIDLLRYERQAAIRARVSKAIKLVRYRRWFDQDRQTFSFSNHLVQSEYTYSSVLWQYG